MESGCALPILGPAELELEWRHRRRTGHLDPAVSAAFGQQTVDVLLEVTAPLGLGGTPI